MPLYEYKCHRCGEIFEVMQKFSDRPLSVHSQCGGELERLLSPPALQFKGSGWYVTDYARSNAPSGNGTSDKPSAEAKTETKAETKAESKTASAPAPKNSSTEK
jgi:putative FmdB family regulatory protein